MEETPVIFPDGASLYCHQVAGHKYDGKSKLGVLKHKDGFIIKPVKEDDFRAAKELSFYENVFSENNSDPILKELTTFLPKFSGTLQLSISNKETNFLCLEDVCQAFQKPSIVDIKIGGRTYDPEADDAKVAYEKSKYEYSELLGFRILGMKIYCSDTDLYVNKDKNFGKQIIPERMKSVLELMLVNSPFISCLILCGFLHKLTELANWFKKQRKFAFYSSSLLFVYEGKISQWQSWISNHLQHLCSMEKENHIENLSSSVTFEKSLLNEGSCSNCLLHKDICQTVLSSCNLLRISMIDCAHVFPTEEEDTNYTFGLENLIKYIRSILNDQRKLTFVKE